MFELISYIKVDEEKLKNHIEKSLDVPIRALGYCKKYDQPYSEDKEIRIFLHKTTFGPDPRDITEEDVLDIMDWLAKDYPNMFEDVQYDEAEHMVALIVKNGYLMI